MERLIRDLSIYVMFVLRIVAGRLFYQIKKFLLIIKYITNFKRFLFEKTLLSTYLNTSKEKSKKKKLNVRQFSILSYCNLKRFSSKDRRTIKDKPLGMFWLPTHSSYSIP